MFLSRPNETLTQHIDSVLRQFDNLNKSKNIDFILNNIINKLCKENKHLTKQGNNIKAILIQMMKLHDEGKKNPYFQSFIGNKEYAQYKFTQLNKHHTEIGAIYFCITMYSKYIADVKRPVQEALKDIVLSLAYNIYRHHSSLQDLDKSAFVEKLINYYEDNKDKEQFINIDLTNIEYLYRFKNRSKIVYKNPYTYYLLCKLSYSLLITSDFTAVYGFNNKEDLKINVVDDKVKNEINEKFSNNGVIKSIREFEKNPNFPLSKLNRYRSKMFLESEKELIKCKDNNIFYLEAPTGCGKSLTSLNLAYNLIDDTVNKIYYIAPFNNIAEQTHKVIKESFYENVVTVNSREDIFISNDDDSINYDKDFLNSQMINYPVALISHVRLFDILFSANRFKNLMLSNLCNSVIIIDEIQSYKNQLWINIINTLKEFAEMLNLKIIIMSATLPKMNDLLEDNTFAIPDLICNRDYYYNYFKQRVLFDFTLLKKDKNDIKEIFGKVEEVIETTNKHRILIECLTTKGADSFYKEMKKYEKEGFLVFKMTGMTNSTNRGYIIKTIQNKSNKTYIYDKIILIGTQCIEAGVDIDMQVGFKDISILDADEQFSGRIERNFNDTGIVYFYDIDNGDFIYKGDFRTEKNLKDDDWKEIFKKKNFSEFYKRNYKWLLEKKIDEYKEYKINLGELKYITIEEDMKLIDSKNYSFLFMSKYEGGRGAEELYKEYLDTQKSNLGYTEKQIKSIQIKKELSNYIYNINTYKFKNEVVLEKVGNLYIVNEGINYFDNLKQGELTKSSTLDVEKFVSYVGLFL